MKATIRFLKSFCEFLLVLSLGGDFPVVTPPSEGKYE